MRHSFVLSTAGAMALGTSVWAQSGTQSNPSNTHQDQATSNCDFVLCETLLDAVVNSPEDRENIADVDDLVVDTRNGKIIYAIIATNGILGSENKTVAVPYGALTWHSGARQLTLDATPEQLASLPECDPEDLVPMQEESWFSTMRGIFDDRPEIDETESNYCDEYSRHFQESDPTSFNGTVVGVEREARTAQGCTCYSLIVEDGEGEKHTVMLAPVAFLTERSTLPTQGDNVTVVAVEAKDADGERVHVAQSVRYGRNTLRLRDEDGVPAWQTSDNRTDRCFYVLASDMGGGSLYADGEEFGSVKDAIFEAHSGTAAFALISVGGVLGIDDTLYPVPCGVFTMGRDNDLHANVSMETLTVAPKLSGDGVADLDDDRFVARIYDHFEMEPKSFDTDRQARWSNVPGASDN